MVGDVHRAAGWRSSWDPDGSRPRPGADDRLRHRSRGRCRLPGRRRAFAAAAAVSTFCDRPSVPPEGDAPRQRIRYGARSFGGNSSQHVQVGRTPRRPRGRGQCPNGMLAGSAAPPGELAPAHDRLAADARVDPKERERAAGRPAASERRGARWSPARPGPTACSGLSQKSRPPPHE